LDAVRGFLLTKNRFYVENQCKKTCLSVLYLIWQHDTPKSRDSRAVFLTVVNSKALNQTVGYSRARWSAYVYRLQTVCQSVVCQIYSYNVVFLIVKKQNEVESSSDIYRWRVFVYIIWYHLCIKQCNYLHWHASLYVVQNSVWFIK